MGIFTKIKKALFEEEEEEIEVKEEPKQVIAEEIKIKHYDDFTPQEMNEKEKEVSPVIFDVEDFIEEQEVISKPVFEEPKQEIPKTLYGGYEEPKIEKEIVDHKFVPSPIISPIYGILDKDYKQEPYQEKKKSLDQLFKEDKKQTVDIDTVRQKAFGMQAEEPVVEEIPKEEDNLLYEMQDVEEAPGIEQISIGDAEEYFEDLGLEYNIDYTDLAKEKMTRSKKNEELSATVEEEIKEDKLIEEETKEENITSEDEAEEKNLYDLIDMMYENK